VPILKGSDASRKAASPVVLRFPDIEAEAASILDRARAEAEEILRRARVEAEAIRRRAYDEGFALGKAEGMEAGREEGKRAALEEAREKFTREQAALVGALQGALAAFESQKRTMLAEFERDVVALAAAIAAKVCKVAVEIDGECLRRNLSEALRLVSDRTAVEIHLNPADVEAARKFGMELLASSEGQRPRFMADGSVDRGGVLVKTASGEIDARIETQLNRILNEILTDWNEHWLLKNKAAGSAQDDERAQ